MSHKSLIIAEKPSVALDIAKALGGFQKKDNFFESDHAIISNGIGHLVEVYSTEMDAEGTKDLSALPVIPSRFQVKPKPKTISQFNLLKKLMNRPDVGSVINACDAGREGELIFRLIYEATGCRKSMKRMWIKSMTPTAIREAYDTVKDGSLYDRIDDAARCRTEGDFIVGINSSRAITAFKSRQERSFQMLAVGRVQTPVLSMITQREDEISTFVQRNFWEVMATFGIASGDYNGRWIPTNDTHNNKESDGSRFFDQSAAKEILDKCRGVQPTSVSEESKITKTHPPKLFNQTALQIEASKRYKFSAKKTLDLTQALYEKHKMVSYPRTSSTALPEDYGDIVLTIMTHLFTGSEYEKYASYVTANNRVDPTNKAIFDNDKISDHFAIIPAIGSQCNVAGLTPDELKIYDLIVRRFIAAFYPVATYSATERLTIVAGETFKTTGRVLLEAGWQVVIKQPTDKAMNSLCALTEGEIASNKVMGLKTGNTTPPSRFNVATLLTAMQTAGKLVDDDDLAEAMKGCGLGTDATRAGIIEGLLSNKTAAGNAKEPYIVTEGKEQFFVPTPKAMTLISFLRENNVLMLINPTMTGEWEQKLSLMEQGKYNRQTFMAEIAANTRQMIDTIKVRASEIPAEPHRDFTGAKCPKCPSTLISTQRTVTCSAECGFKLRRSQFGRDCTDHELAILINQGKSQFFDDFISKNKKPYSAQLILQPNFEVTLSFDNPTATKGDNPTATKGEVLSSACPSCQGEINLLTGNYPSYKCGKCAFKLNKVIAGRTLSDDEVVSLITHGYLGKKSGYTGKKGKFSAGLNLDKKTGSVTFTFEG